jgi:hypothetical protein
MFFKQNAPQIPKKILKARYARAATQQAATRRQLMLGELFQAGQAQGLHCIRANCHTPESDFVPLRMVVVSECFAVWVFAASRVRDWTYMYG